MQIQHIVLEPAQHAARRIPGDAAIGDFDTRESVADVPFRGDRVPQEDDRALILSL